ncbi:MAG: radical SAM protein [Muribaculaceae bacterium]|nr:radical SAM protein [Muribaculaceae bacterium]
MNLSERYKEKLSEEVGSVEVGLDNVLVQLEVTNACNHKCYFCPNSESIRPIKVMDYQFARNIMHECAQFLGQKKKICFHMNGEPLLYRQLPELVRYSKELGYEYSFVTTNGSLATDEVLTALFEAGLDSIKFSINAGSREAYCKIHGKDDFEKATHALEFSAAYRKAHDGKFKIFVSCVATKDNYEELEAFNAYAKQYCDEVVFYYPCGYAGQNNKLARELRCDLSGLNISAFEIRHTSPCPVLWNSINVTCERFLSLCCSESDNRLIVEDLNEIGVKEAWLGKKMQEIRRRHLEKKVQDMPCFSCITEQEYEEASIDGELFSLAARQRKENTRIKKQVTDIDYGQTKTFFDKRAGKYRDSNPYSVTMYQDDNPRLVDERNREETAKLLPLLKLDRRARVLDLACGIGRWADAITEEIEEYCGIDFSEELIRLARQRHDGDNRDFLVGSAVHLKKVLEENGKGKYNRILMIGIFMYINDRDLDSVMEQLAEAAEEKAVLCIREPLGVDERLTLKGFYSDELRDNYNAIYRTRGELQDLLERTLVARGFQIVQSDFLFSKDALNNRQETAQYYYILER